jgi:hypothetical protein
MDCSSQAQWGMNMNTQAMIQDYLARGGRIHVCKPSLMPVCQPIPRSRLQDEPRYQELLANVWQALASLSDRNDSPHIRRKG